MLTRNYLNRLIDFTQITQGRLGARRRAALIGFTRIVGGQIRYSKAHLLEYLARQEELATD